MVAFYAAQIIIKSESYINEFVLWKCGVNEYVEDTSNTGIYNLKPIVKYLYGELLLIDTWGIYKDYVQLS